MLIIDCDRLSFSLFILSNLGFKGCKSLLIAETVICFALIDELLRIFHIDSGLHSLTLYIRTVSAVLIGTFVMLKTCGFQSSVNDLGCAFNKSLLICVLYT